MKLLFFLFAGALFLLSSCGSAVSLETGFSEASSVSDGLEISGSEAQISSSEFIEDLPETIYVYVCGAVNDPGVYELPYGSRTFEAVEAAGGVTKKADLRSFNQAEILSDAQMVIVYTKNETKDRGVAAQGGEEGSGKVNINQADLTELMTLPGIGEAKANAIIKYREENGSFAAIEDIMKISGIKDKMFSQIKDLITV